MRGFHKSVRSRVRALSPAAALGVAALFTSSAPVVLSAALPAAAQAAVNAKITNLDPQDVYTVGNDLVFISGDNLPTVTKVTVDDAPVDFVDEGDGSLSFFTPTHAVGTAQVRITTADGTAPDNGTVDDLRYTVPPPIPVITSVTPNAGPLSGGTKVDIKGQNLATTIGVVFGDFALAADLTIISDNEITVTAPSSSTAGKVNILVINGGGSNDNTTADDYTYGGTPVVAPTVTSISPTSGAAGTTVTLTGTGLAGASVKFGASDAASVTQVSATQVTAVSPAGSGTVDVTASNSAGTSPIVAGDKYSYPVPAVKPVVTGIAPTSGTTLGGTSVTITGTDLTGAAAVTFDGVAATSIQSVSSTTLKVTSPPHGAGKADVVVTTAGGTSANTSADDYTYVTPPPTVTGISPATGVVGGGTSVTISGTNLTGATGVTFDGTAGTGVTVVSSTQVKVTSPPHAAGKADVIVTTAGGASANTSADDFTYFVPAPVVTGISPTSGLVSGGTVVTITGQNLAGATVTFGGKAASAVDLTSATSIKATAPAGSLGKADVVVTTAGGPSANTSADDFTYLPPAPAITGIAPASGSTLGGNTVTITGTNLTGATAVKFGSASASSVNVVSATQVTATAPAGSAGTVDVSVTTAGGTSAGGAADNYTYVVPAPTVTGISPASGVPTGGTVVTITGTNLSNVTGVKFGSVAATNVQQVSATQVKATSPAVPVGGGTTFDVSVTTAGGTSANTAADDFTYVAVVIPAPTVIRISPQSGLPAGGTAVTVNGNDLGGATAVTFGTVEATSFVQVSSTQITAIAPPGTVGTSVDVTVTTPSGTSAAVSGGKFTYTAVSPLIPRNLRIFPNAGVAYVGGVFTIQGVNLKGVRYVKIGSKSARFVIVGQTIVVVAPGQPKGVYPVTVTTVFGTSVPTAAARYTYVGF